MAVVQISRIQLRRGQKNSVSGIPQLASAEMAWAVDAQELYIGNGSVAEGSPYVGNTRILTEHENLLDLISSYQYAADDLTMEQYSVSRSIQNKLDEYVSVADFGVLPGETSVDFFNIAMQALYRSGNTEYHKVLTIPNGVYTLNADLEIPSNVILRGETPGGVVFDIGEYNIRFITDDGEFLNSGNNPTNVHLSNIMIRRTTGRVILTGLKKSVFDDVTFAGDFTILDITSADDAAALASNSAVYWENTAAETTVTDIKFNRCSFLGNMVSIVATNFVSNTSNIYFDECNFIDNYYSTVIIGVAGQNNFWKYRSGTFENIYSSAFLSTYGKGTVIRGANFINVGNKSSGPTLPQAPMVEFGERAGNLVVDCFSDRMQTANIQTSENVHAVPEVLGGDKVSFFDRIVTDFGLSDTPIPFAVLSAATNTYTINYVLRLGEIYRKGELTIAVGNNINPSNDDLSISDDYTISPNLSLTSPGIIISEFEFSVSIHDNNSDGINDTIALMYQNNVEHTIDGILIAAGQTGDISFDISYTN